jgi:hypothetical protein
VEKQSLFSIAPSQSLDPFVVGCPYDRFLVVLEKQKTKRKKTKNE